jgi:hypothetical protein
MCHQIEAVGCCQIISFQYFPITIFFNTFYKALPYAKHQKKITDCGFSFGCDLANDNRQPQIILLYRQVCRTPTVGKCEFCDYDICRLMA